MRISIERRRNDDDDAEVRRVSQALLAPFLISRRRSQEELYSFVTVGANQVFANVGTTTIDQ